MSDEKKTCGDCEHFTPTARGKGRCVAPLPWWLNDASPVIPEEMRAGDCKLFEQKEET